jgi:phospholipase A2
MFANLYCINYSFLANDEVPGVDPMISEFMSTWNFVYTPEEIDKVTALARANFDQGKAQTQRTVRAVYERKRSLRLRREADEKEIRQRYYLRQLEHSSGDDDNWDHFSQN